MLIDGQEVSPEYAQALKEVNVAMRALSESPWGAGRQEAEAVYRRALAHAVAVKKKENPMTLKEAQDARNHARGTLHNAILGAQEAQKAANEILRVYQDDPRGSIRERWEKAMVIVTARDTDVGLYVRALGKAEEDLKDAKAAAGHESYTVEQIEAAYSDVEHFTKYGLLAALRSLP